MNINLRPIIQSYYEHQRYKVTLGLLFWTFRLEKNCLLNWSNPQWTCSKLVLIATEIIKWLDVYSKYIYHWKVSWAVGLFNRFVIFIEHWQSSPGLHILKICEQLLNFCKKKIFLCNILSSSVVKSMIKTGLIC